MIGNLSDDSTVVERVTATGDLHRYCRRCRTLRPVRIKPADDDNYYEQEVSVVVCESCGNQLGHLTWWPDEP